MEYIVVCIAAVITSGLTLFSGFGVGTLLMPVFAVFFKPEIAIGMTALVHFANNIFKLILMGKHADRDAVISFGFPAIATAFIGASLLTWLSRFEPLHVYEIAGKECSVSSVKLVIAFLMILFALTEILPFVKKMKIDKSHLWIGGILSGFFGGLSGHQGALRSVFLLRCGFSKETFIGTGVIVSCMVDAMRISVYIFAIMSAEKVNPMQENGGLIAAACLAAFLGAFIGKRLLKKVTIKTVQWIVAIMLFVIAIGLGSGLI